MPNGRTQKRGGAPPQPQKHNQREDDQTRQQLHIHHLREAYEGTLDDFYSHKQLEHFLYCPWRREVGRQFNALANVMVKHRPHLNAAIMAFGDDDKIDGGEGEGVDTPRTTKRRRSGSNTNTVSIANAGKHCGKTKDSGKEKSEDDANEGVSPSSALKAGLSDLVRLMKSAWPSLNEGKESRTKKKSRGEKKASASSSASSSSGGSCFCIFNEILDYPPEDAVSIAASLDTIAMLIAPPTSSPLWAKSNAFRKPKWPAEVAEKMAKSYLGHLLPSSSPLSEHEGLVETKPKPQRATVGKKKSTIRDATDALSTASLSTASCSQPTPPPPLPSLRDLCTSAPIPIGHRGLAEAPFHPTVTLKSEVKCERFVGSSVLWARCDVVTQPRDHAVVMAAINVVETKVLSPLKTVLSRFLQGLEEEHHSSDSTTARGLSSNEKAATAEGRPSRPRERRRRVEGSPPTTKKSRANGTAEGTSASQSSTLTALNHAPSPPSPPSPSSVTTRRSLLRSADRIEAIVSLMNAIDVFDEAMSLLVKRGLMPRSRVEELLLATNGLSVTESSTFKASLVEMEVKKKNGSVDCYGEEELFREPSAQPFATSRRRTAATPPSRKIQFIRVVNQTSYESLHFGPADPSPKNSKGNTSSADDNSNQYAFQSTINVSPNTCPPSLLATDDGVSSGIQQRTEHPLLANLVGPHPPQCYIGAFLGFPLFLKHLRRLNKTHLGKSNGHLSLQSSSLSDRSAAAPIPSLNGPVIILGMGGNVAANLIAEQLLAPYFHFDDADADANNAPAFSSPFLAANPRFSLHIVEMEPSVMATCGLNGLLPGYEGLGEGEEELIEVSTFIPSTDACSDDTNAPSPSKKGTMQEVHGGGRFGNSGGNGVFRVARSRNCPSWAVRMQHDLLLSGRQKSNGTVQPHANGDANAVPTTPRMAKGKKKAATAPQSAVATPTKGSSTVPLSLPHHSSINSETILSEALAWYVRTVRARVHYHIGVDALNTDLRSLINKNKSENKTHDTADDDKGKSRNRRESTRTSAAKKKDDDHRRDGGGDGDEGAQLILLDCFDPMLSQLQDPIAVLGRFRSALAKKRRSNKPLEEKGDAAVVEGEKEEEEGLLCVNSHFSPTDASTGVPFAPFIKAFAPSPLLFEGGGGKDSEANGPFVCALQFNALSQFLIVMGEAEEETDVTSGNVDVNESVVKAGRPKNAKKNKKTKPLIPPAQGVLGRLSTLSGLSAALAGLLHAPLPSPSTNKSSPSPYGAMINYYDRLLTGHMAIGTTAACNPLPPALKAMAAATLEAWGVRRVVQLDVLTKGTPPATAVEGRGADAAFPSTQKRLRKKRQRDDDGANDSVAEKGEAAAAAEAERHWSVPLWCA